MKKLFALLVLTVFGGLFLLSCSRTEYVDNTTDIDNDTYNVVYDLKNVNFSYNTTDGYNISRTFTNPLYSSDVVLIYRQSGTTNGTPIWQQIPRTLYLTQGELDYDFDFSKYDFMIYAGGSYDISTTPAYINNQTFRVVIVPASFGKNATVDYSDYNSVIKHFNIDESKVINL